MVKYCFIPFKVSIEWKSITIASSNFIFPGLLGCTAVQGSILCSLFLIYIKPNHVSIVSTVKELAADDILVFIAIPGKLNSHLKANQNGHPFILSFNPDLNQAPKVIFMENYKIIPLTNLFQHSLSAEILSEWKIELPYLVRNFQMNARNKQQSALILNMALKSM